MQLFRDYYQVQEVDFDALEFEKACKAKNVKAVLGALGQEWADNMITTAPFGAVLRVAEGLDALSNLGRSGMSNSTGMERGAAIVCGLSQLGGLLFSAVAIVFALVLCVCAPIGSGLAVLVYKRCKRRRQLSFDREVEIDAMLEDRKLANVAHYRVTPVLGGVDAEREPFL
tara:strand:- start:2679 stop:3191 length:513 start_codon:yes stop_codon:yes gene_type:complete